MRKTTESKDILEYARGLLAIRPRSEREMRERLNKRFPAGEVEEALRDLHDRGFLDDRDFARWWIRERVQAKPCGRLLLRQELLKKGVPGDILGAVLEEEMGSVCESDLAVEAAKGVIARYSKLPREVRMRRLGAFLGRRGFDYHAVTETLSRLDEEYNV